MTKRVSSQPFDCHTQKIKETKLPSPPLKYFFLYYITAENKTVTYKPDY